MSQNLRKKSLGTAIATLKTKIETIPGGHKLLAKNAAWVFALRIVQKLSSLIMMYFLVRGLSQDQFAFFNLVLTTVSLMSIFTLPELSTAVTQSVARGFTGTYRRIMPISFCSSLLGTLGLLAAAIWYYLKDTEPQAISFAIAALLFPFAMGLEQWKGFKKGLEDFKTIVWLSGQMHFVRTVLITLSIIIFPGNFVLPLLFYFTAGSFRNILQTFRALKVSKKEDPAEEKSLAYGIKASLISFTNVVANQLDKILLYFFVSPIEMAILVVAEKIPELCKNMIQDMANVLMPRFAKQKTYTRNTDKKLKLISLAIGGAILFFSLTIFPFIAEFIFGRQYIDAIPYGIALLLTIAIGNYSTFRSRFVMSKLDLSSYRDITIGMSLARIVASIVLVPMLGLTGAVASTVIYRLAMTGLVEYVFRKRYTIAD